MSVPLSKLKILLQYFFEDKKKGAKVSQKS